AALGGSASTERDDHQSQFMSHVGPGGAPVACGAGGCPSTPYQARAMPGVMTAFGESIAAPGAGTLAAPRPGMLTAGNLNAAEMAARANFAQSMPPQIVTQILTRDD